MSREVREKIFLDVETTGLSQETDSLVELTYATMFGDPVTLYFGVEKVPPFIDDLIGFTKRGISGWRSTDGDIDEFRQVTKGQTMVSANPPFDAGFLNVNKLNEFHYRNLDIESYAIKPLDLDFVPGMKDIYDILTDKGFKLTEPDHTSRNDVLALREAYKILTWGM